MQRRNWKESPDPVVKRVEWINKRTGEVEQIPAGIDPGWDVNPGKNRREQLDKLMKGKLDAADPQVAQVARRDLEEYRKGTK